MGSAFARRLLGAGMRVSVWNRSPAAAERLADVGAKVAATSEEAVRDAGVVMLVADHSMRLTDASDIACELLGYDRQELLTLSVPDIVVDQPLAERLYTEYLRDREQGGLIGLRTKDGRTVEAVYYAFTQGPDSRVSVLFPL